MNILLTNDDGYGSEGLVTMERTLSAAGHDVWVCAPNGQRSATSHSMTLRGDVVVTRYAERGFHCSGTPADCVLYAVKGGVLPVKPDMVISGINHGYNLSTDILYSGTLGAAREASLMDIRAIAISAWGGKKPIPFAEAASFLTANLEFFLGFCDSTTLVNINVPPNPTGQWDVGGIGRLEYYATMQSARDVVRRIFDTSGTSFGSSAELTSHTFDSHSLAGRAQPSALAMEGEYPPDYELAREGIIAVTPLHILPAIDTAAARRMRRSMAEES
ncbi:5'/3'-nucleotidase SurE [Parasphaerochaeta coccoides]|uniref:5'-nucleotidase SurE n=1 Tax=Parasphaerochaeta coccoides (strain ATCC BAA-1237 / DSM 17374 / SPN1) TaxID=760011 RepID=F4GLP8_PARC1|nr:5'/3'-nucleotidase SurE [Parasphaerochaeta coccoides]AEC02442.1 Multifunctional protein surE [Parasphaerochaeta coccoides DSM 17374]